MTLQETAQRAFERSGSGVIILSDGNRIPFDAVRSYRDNDGEFSITVGTSTGEKAYHSDQIKDIQVDTK